MGATVGLKMTGLAKLGTHIDRNRNHAQTPGGVILGVFPVLEVDPFQAEIRSIIDTQSEQG